MLYFGKEFGYILPCPKNLYEAGYRDTGLIWLTEKVSRPHSICAVSWFLFTALIHSHNESKKKVEQKVFFQSMEFGEERYINSFKFLDKESTDRCKISTTDKETRRLKTNLVPFTGAGRKGSSAQDPNHQRLQLLRIQMHLKGKS